MQRGGTALPLRVRTTRHWESASSVAVPSYTGFKGVALARAAGDIRSLLAYTENDRLKVFAGLGFTFSTSADHELPGVGSPPSLVHVQGNQWLVAYVPTGGGAIEVRPYRSESGADGGFGNPLNLTAAMTGNDNVSGRPAMAYINGRLFLVWGRVAGNRAFRYIAADYQPRGSAISVVQSGEISSAGTYVSEFQTAPALTHDGVATFYLAAVYRSGLTGLTYDVATVFRSGDGRSWTREQLPLLDGPTGQMRVGIAAKRNGDVLLAVVAGPNNPTRVLRLRDGAWNEIGDAAFGALPDYQSDFALIRHQYSPSDELVFSQSPNPIAWDIHAMRFDGTNVMKVTDTGHAWYPHWSSRGDVVLEEGSNIAVLDFDRGAVVKLTNNSLSDSAMLPFWSADGRRIAFSTYQWANGGTPVNAEISVMNADGSNRVDLTATPDFEGSPAWSADGLRIVYQREAQPLANGDIWLINADGSGETNLTNTPNADEHSPSWHPSGTWIAYVRSTNPYAPRDIWIMNADGSNPTALFNLPNLSMRSPQYSPDGAKIAFSGFSVQPAEDGLYVANADGSQLTQIVSGLSVGSPNWSPGSDKLAFRVDQDIFVVDADGSDLRNLTNGSPGIFRAGLGWRPRL